MIKQLMLAAALCVPTEGAAEVMKLFDGKTFNNAGRLRINGHAQIDDRPEAIEGLPGAKRMIRVRAEYIYTNCPRYIPKLATEKSSVYSPRENYSPPDPDWKSMPFVKDVFDRERE